MEKERQAQIYFEILHRIKVQEIQVFIRKVTICIFLVLTAIYFVMTDSKSIALALGSVSAGIFLLAILSYFTELSEAKVAKGLMAEDKLSWENYYAEMQKED